MNAIEAIKEVKPILWGEELSSIFKGQNELISLITIGVEGLPKPPIDLSTKESQILIRDFINRTTEELSEAYAVYEEMVNLNDSSTKDDETFNKLKSLLYNFNEKISDSLHFLIELLIYSNIDEDDIQRYYDILLGELNLKDVILFENMGKTIFAYARHINVYHNQLYHGSELKRKPFLQHPEDQFLQGGRLLNADMLEIVKTFSWDIVHNLQLAAGFLKNKAWKNTFSEIDIDSYHKQIMEAFLSYFVLMDILGYNEEGLARIYAVKNHINKIRIQNGY